MAKKKSKHNSVDVKSIFARFGGISATHVLLLSHGYDISKSAIEKWSARSRIPANWLVTLITVAKKIKKPLNINTYIEEPKAQAPVPAHDDTLKDLSFPGLARVRESLLEEIAKLEEELTNANKEILARLAGPIQSGFADKPSGLARLEHDGLSIVLEIRKTVKWDQGDLKGLANKLPADVAARVFDVELKIPEKIYEAMARTDLQLYASLGKARTVKYSPPSIKQIDIPKAKQ